MVDVTDRVRTYHRIVEAFKFGYAKRSALGDEDYVNVTDVRRLQRCLAYRTGCVYVCLCVCVDDIRVACCTSYQTW